MSALYDTLRLSEVTPFIPHETLVASLPDCFVYPTLLCQEAVFSNLYLRERDPLYRRYLSYNDVAVSNAEDVDKRYDRIEDEDDYDYAMGGSYFQRDHRARTNLRVSKSLLAIFKPVTSNIINVVPSQISKLPSKSWMAIGLSAGAMFPRRNS